MSHPHPSKELRSGCRGGIELAAVGNQLVATASSKLLSDFWRRATSSISPDWTGLVATCSGSEASAVAVVYTGGIPGCRSRYTDHGDEDVTSSLLNLLILNFILRSSRLAITQGSYMSVNLRQHGGDKGVFVSPFWHLVLQLHYPSEKSASKLRDVACMLFSSRTHSKKIVNLCKNLKVPEMARLR
ncbi:unnamed protein product [Urochloa humidicola]